MQLYQDSSPQEQYLFLLVQSFNIFDNLTFPLRCMSHLRHQSVFNQPSPKHWRGTHLLMITLGI